MWALTAANVKKLSKSCFRSGYFLLRHGLHSLTAPKGIFAMCFVRSRLWLGVGDGGCVYENRGKRGLFLHPWNFLRFLVFSSRPGERVRARSGVKKTLCKSGACVPCHADASRRTIGGSKFFSLQGAGGRTKTCSRDETQKKTVGSRDCQV